jgi:hypothetical protein
MRKKKRKLQGILLLLFILLLSGGIWYEFVYNPGRIYSNSGYGNTDAFVSTKNNYGEDVDLYAREFNLPSSYLLALIVLESSGRKVVPPRFEPQIYQYLKEVKQGKRASFEHVTPRHLTDATDDALKNLASSWGPFQLMGYKCLLLGIKVRDIRGPDAVYWGIKWIDMTYGKELRAKRYKDAFHIHNTGRRFPLIGKPFTHDPGYVYKGLSYMKRFESDTLTIRPQ